MSKEKPTTKVCKHCKTEIPSNAKICPQCRKKQGPGGCLIAIIVFVAIGIIGSCFGGKDDKKVDSTKVTATTNTSQDDASHAETVTPIEETEVEEILEITPGDLLDSYEANEVKGDQVYKDKKMRLTGTISDIGKDIMENVYITFKGNEEYSITSVQCFFKDKAEIEKVMELNKGDTITVIGICDGKFGNVTIKKCIIE